MTLRFSRCSRPPLRVSLASVPYLFYKTMSTTSTSGLGKLELAVLMAVARLGDEAYGLGIRHDVSVRRKHDYSVGAIYTTLGQLERKGPREIVDDRTAAGQRRPIPPPVRGHRARPAGASRGASARRAAPGPRGQDEARMSRPSFAERVLLGFLTDPALGDAILGDLTEEWRTRITRDGRMSADLWDWGQAIRTMPHLLRDWCVSATRRDVRLRLAVTSWSSLGSQRCLPPRPM